jgi:hypothetical protein
MSPRVAAELWSRSISLGWAISLTCLLCSDCADSKGSPDAANATGDAAHAVHVRFDLGQGGAMSLGAIPWPDDLYLDQQNRVTLADFPMEPDTDYGRALRASLGDLDGFGVSTPIYFFLDGAIDSSGLPQTADESVSERASVYLIDVDTGSPTAYQRVRTEIQWTEGLNRIALRPAAGEALTPGRLYAAIVTRRLKDKNGAPVEPGATFAAVRAETAPADARLSQAWQEYNPVLNTLAISREDFVAMAVFRVQNTASDLGDARKIVRSGNRPTPTVSKFIAGRALDDALGTTEPTAAPHDHLQAMIHGTLSSPCFVSATLNVHGAWERDDGGQLRVKRTDDVPFTLFVPAGATNIPIVIYQHQRGHERSDAVVLANVLAADGIAVLAIDAPFQGYRASSTDQTGKGVDTRNRFTGKATADYFGDVAGDFYGSDETRGDLVRFHPFYVRDAIRQGVVDLMTLVRFVDEGDFSPITSMLGSDAPKFDTTKIGFVGEDVGAQMGVLLAPSEPKLQALVLFAASALVSQSWWRDAADQALFAQLSQLLGRDAQNIDYVGDSPAFWPELALFDTLLGRAEPLAYTTSLQRSAANVLLLIAQDDEAVANLSSEALSVALGASFLAGDARYVGDLNTQDAMPGDGVSGNFSVENYQVTRLLQSYDPADHQLLLAKAGAQSFVHPPDPPFQALTAAKTIDNPHAAALTQVASYMRSFFDCVQSSMSSASALKCAASVTAN